MMKLDLFCVLRRAEPLIKPPKLVRILRKPKAISAPKKKEGTK